MTKRERILNAFNNKPVDKVPMGFWYHFSPDEDLGQKTIDQHVELFHEADTDLIKIMCDGYFNYPNPFIDTVTCPEDWFQMTPMGEDHPWITKQVERAKGVVEAVKGGVLCILQCILPYVPDALWHQRAASDDAYEAEPGGCMPCL